ncbi:evolutionarily conserved signaling intermediate in Toll pathway, mitochondrial-like isoform X1 [Hydra vulgaris]|uniref:evolutionarily conserved signaling intermediate in Toll pathway, mitochondrial-like isoform X1 n=1 Tax=Hydra vulgaris TaxID=6087 RepID=UPI0032E9D262
MTHYQSIFKTLKYSSLASQIRALHLSSVIYKEKYNMEKIEFNELLKEVNMTNKNKSKPMPVVDLTSTRGITVKHLNSASQNSAFLKHCLESQPNKDGFIKAVDQWINKNKVRHGHIDFIATAMKFIEPYGLGKEIEVYQKLFDVFPRDRFNNKTLLDAVWPKPHPQMHLALDILSKMEEHGVSPTLELHDLVFEIFGRASFPLKKIYNMYFWFYETKDINPYKLPEEVYKDRLNVIKAAIDRILGNNKGTQVVELSPGYQDENDVVNYEHFIISSQTFKQRQYVKLCSSEKTLYVEGPTHIWINHKKENYFVLKTGQGDLKTFEWTKVDPDEEREGVILAICFASRPFQETLQRWISHLQNSNSVLKQCNIVFNINEYMRDQVESTLSLAKN